MSQLTTTSKILIITGCIAFLILLGFGCYSCISGCNQRQNNQSWQQPQQNIYVEPTQPQYQTVVRDDGSSFVMNYLLWKSLMDQGGPNVVNNYYDSHRNEPEFQPQRQQEARQVHEQQVQTQKSSGFGSKQTQTNSSNGFGSRPTETNKSNGFGSKSVETNKSNGFGNQTSKPSIPSVNTNRSSGFGSSTSTKSSSGFGSKSSSPSSSPSKSTSTSKSNGFGKKN